MLWIGLHYLVVLACAARVLLRPHREPMARLAWLAVLFALPGIGVIAYLLLGETGIGKKRREQRNRVFADLPRPEETPGWADLSQSFLPEDSYKHLFSWSVD
jgi:cardiolipin synthase A/B